MKNTLALIEEILVRAKNDGTQDRVDAYVIALARKMGIGEECIHECLADDYMTVIYRP